MCLPLVLAACSASPNKVAGPGQSSASPASASPSVSSTAPADPALAATLVSVYAATYTDVEAAVRVGGIHSASLSRHAVAPALNQLQFAVEQYLRVGVVPVGVPSLDARVTAVNTDENPMEAVLVACPAAPPLVSLSTGKPVAFRAIARNPITVDLQSARGRWVVSYLDVNRKLTCAG